MFFSAELNMPKDIEDTILLYQMSMKCYNCELHILDEKKICASLTRMNDAHCLS